MREIKFRAWDKVKEKWYKNVLSLSDGMFLIEDINGYKEVVSIPSFINDRAPNEFAIMQFTGLKDKNGKEIYEGDAVRYKYNPTEEWNENCVGDINWKGTGFCFVNRWLVSLPGAYVSEDKPLVEEFEVIGNIYENPELINK